MKLKNAFLIFALSVACLSESPMKAANNYELFNTNETTQKDKYSVHVVQAGQTVYSISVAYGTTVEDIYKLNPFTREGIKDGDMIRIPKPRIKEYKEHKVEAKETLYGISKLYALTTDDLTDANPGLTPETFKIGKKIKIPVYEKPKTKDNGKPIEHKVEKDETLYSISRAYNVSTDAIRAKNPKLDEKGLKIGMKLLIPADQIGTLAPEKVEKVPIVAEVPETKEEDNIYRIGVLLPFADEKGSIPKDKIAEYYEGFLLAVKEMKEKNMNAEIYTFDIGTDASPQRLATLLGSTELKGLSLIIGGTSPKQIATISNFSKKNQINYVIPFGGQSPELKLNTYSFQMVNSHANLMGKIIQKFESQFKNYNIIFIEETNAANKTDFGNELKKRLTTSNIPFKSVLPSTSLTNELGKAIDTSKKNLIIPTSSSEMAVKRITQILRTYDEKIAVSLFGYPEWQTYTSQTASFHLYDTYIYSSFFFDEKNSDSKKFIGEYQKWYIANLIPSFPKYGCMGYDAGIYFLNGLNKYGVDFDTKMSSLKTNTLQSAMNFQRSNNQSGFINEGFYFIHYRKGGDIQKSEQ